MNNKHTAHAPKKLRVGIVGAGGIVRQRHLPGLLALPNVQIVAVCNARIETARRVAKEFHVPEVMDDWAEMLDRPDLDIIWVGTPPVLHAPITISALEAGKHVFCQARMAMNLGEGREMLAAAQARPQLVTMLCPPPHGMKGGKFFQKLLRDGYAGELWHFRLVADNDQFADPLAPAHWRQRTELSGHNVLTVGIYAEVLQRWLGLPRRLHAQMKVSVPKREGYVVHVPDVVQVFGQWPNGLAGVLEWSGVAQFPPDETLTIYGRDGTLVYNFTKDEIHGARRGETKLRLLEIPPELETAWTVEKDFIDAVVHGGHPEPSFETGVQYLEFTEAVNLSARGGHAVELPLP
ncbi:MAG TPA: Gfo/Idh/MocA family oxidoreductase [Candidatus Methylacidiphilales bacterium]|jgi:predicted dehydrogenase|nr:Gfo/Idh/MocA family oxidoreductase [Candidatus Methylacidiphilales bacterium]